MVHDITPNAQEYYFSSEKCFITELSNSEDDKEMSIAKARVRPGITTCWHRLRGTTERYLILSGCGFVEVGESYSRNVTEGGVVVIPPMTRQRITNTGEEDLIFLVICSPRFLPEVYESLEQD